VLVIVLRCSCEVWQVASTKTSVIDSVLAPVPMSIDQLRIG
jgi:hypothetical protein